MEKLYELHEEGGYDLIVVDTPPTRHALDFLDAPKRLTRLLDNRIFRLLMVPTRAYLRVASVAVQAFLHTVSRVGTGSSTTSSRSAHSRDGSGIPPAPRPWPPARRSAHGVRPRDHRPGASERGATLRRPPATGRTVRALIVNRVLRSATGPPACVRPSGCGDPSDEAQRLAALLRQSRRLPRRGDSRASTSRACDKIGSATIAFSPTPAHDVFPGAPRVGRLLIDGETAATLRTRFHGSRPSAERPSVRYPPLVSGHDHDPRRRRCEVGARPECAVPQSNQQVVEVMRPRCATFAEVSPTRHPRHADREHGRHRRRDRPPARGVDRSPRPANICCCSIAGRVHRTASRRRLGPREAGRRCPAPPPKLLPA